MKIDAFVHVTGNPTHEEDASVPGFYLIKVNILDVPDGTPVASLVANMRSEIATAALDEFHNHQGIEELDPFTFTVYAEDGTVLEELEVDESWDMENAVASYVSAIDADELPKPVIAVAFPAQEKTPVRKAARP